MFYSSGVVKIYGYLCKLYLGSFRFSDLEKTPCSVVCRSCLWICWYTWIQSTENFRMLRVALCQYKVSNKNIHSSNLPKRKCARNWILLKCLRTWKVNFVLYSFIHLVVCLKAGPQPLPKRTLHIVPVVLYNILVCKIYNLKGNTCK